MAGGFFSSQGMLGTSGTPASIYTTNPYDQMVSGGQSGNFNDMTNMNSTYLADMFSQLGTGNAPSYYQNYQNQALPYQQNQNAMKFFGTGGNRSVDMYGNPTQMGLAAQNAAMFGWNPKAQASQMNRVGQQYQQASSAIDQYFAGQGLNVINQTAQALPGWANNQMNALTQAFKPDTTLIPGQQGTTGFLGNLATAVMSQYLGGGMPSMGGGGGGGGMADSFGNYSGGVNAGQYSDMYSGGPMSFSSGGSGFAAAPYAM